MIGTLEQRFWAKVDRWDPDECWQWTGYPNGHGYGQLRIGGENSPMVTVHRYSYELLVGPIPEGLTLDHLCRNRGCVNPNHLEPVTMYENVMRGVGPTAINARKTHCLRGHAFDDVNTYITVTGGRSCRKCMNINVRAYRIRKRQRAAA